MAPKNVFRIVVGLSIAFTIASAVAALLPGKMSEDWTTLLQWHGNSGVSEQLIANIPESYWVRAVLSLLAVGFLAYAIAIIIGMFVFWRFARFGFIFLTALSIVLVPFDGLVVMTPVEAALFQLVLVLDGVIVAMAYLPPICGQFEKDA